MGYSDKEIIESICNGGNNKIISYLYKTYFPRIKKFITNNCGKQEDAEDIFQEAVISFYKQVKMDRFKEEYEIGAFLFTVARNAWINQAKRKRITVDIEENREIISYDSNALDGMISEERESLIMDVIGQLGDRCKELLINTIYHKFSMKEICEKMGFSSENAAKTKNYKCKQRLIGLLKQNPVVQELL